MTRFVHASLMAVLAISSIAAPTAAVPTTATAAVTSPAALPFYRETLFYSTEYSQPFPSGEPGPTPWPTSERIMVGWHRYYCDGTVRTYGYETGDYEDYTFGDCT